MKLNHVNLCSSDVTTLANTLENHFGYRTLELGTVPDAEWATNPGSTYAILVGDDVSDIVITQIDPVPEGESAYPSQFHFGIMQDTAQAVHAKHAELEQAGFTPGKLNPGFEVLGATWTAFYCPLGDGLEIEINHRTHSELLDGTN
ncbi:MULTISPECIES: VOC family protein [unclassified Curtobacterium]|uniref:VOC family protein n=1 Tax=unclassified Curtobacterium TaxID=257496 RepID=UPI0021DA6FB8|nr:hypothetical protein [Curtobacterium sp. RIT-PI-V]